MTESAGVSGKEKINASILLENLLQSFQELMDLKSITLTREIKSGVMIPLSYPLAEIMMNNLLGNAIRHNVMSGRIDVKLTKGCLVLQNSGVPLNVSPDDLFKRFKKGNQSAGSTGLGLSIVKQICDLAHMKISYRFENAMHILTLTF